MTAMIVMAACGTTSGTGSGADTANTVDAPTPVTSEGVTCDKTSTTTLTSGTGTKTVNATHYALIAVDASAAFSVEECDPQGIIAPTGCPSGFTCAVTGDAIPAGPCIWARGGTFYGGNLFVQCSYNTTSYDANGSMISSSSYGYGTIRLHR